jgi:hypothetical protein
MTKDTWVTHEQAVLIVMHLRNCSEAEAEELLRALAEAKPDSCRIVHDEPETMQ